MARLDELLRLLRTSDGSDLHLAAGMAPRIRRSGDLEVVDGWSVLSDSELRALMREIASDAQWSEFERASDLDFAYGLASVARFRANYFVQEHGAGAVFRIIPEKILTAKELALPPAIEKLAELRQGLVLITGPTGSGKSTTLAAVIHTINEKYARHIVTIEDPVEFVHENRGSVLSHREVGSHTKGFAPALRAAVRQDADVVLVGEMRDLDTIAAALTAAEMGLLVFGTLHTNSASKTIDRIVDAFPARDQNQVRLTLSESLAAVVSQLLLPRAKGKGRIAVHEILLRTSALPNLIREGNTPMLRSLIQGGKTQGMQLMDDALFALVQSGEIRAEDAHKKAVEKARFETLIPKERLESAA
jgi:twitching motility protein PilT